MPLFGVMDEEPALDDDPVLLLHDVKTHLRRRADRRIGDALKIGALMLAGHTPTETRAQLGLSQGEYEDAARSLRVAITEVSEDRVRAAD